MKVFLLYVLVGVVVMALLYVVGVLKDRFSWDEENGICPHCGARGKDVLEGGDKYFTCLKCGYCVGWN